MSQSEEIINQLNQFKLQDKFSDSVWESRGLISSDDKLCRDLSNFFNNCTDELIAAVQENSSKDKLKKIIKHLLKQLNKFNYDTEERELICEYFYRLGRIVNINLAYTLNAWLYGTILATLLSFKKEEKIVDTLKQPCTNCGVILETYVTKYEEGIPESDFFIVRCSECEEYNLLNLGKNIKGLRLVIINLKKNYGQLTPQENKLS